MKLTKHTDYAFRVLIYLASMNEDKTTIQHITNEYQTSKTHLMKIVNKLANNGWVHTVRGKNGGISLAIEAKAINVRDVIELMEETLIPVNCASCMLKNICDLQSVLFNAQETYLKHLSRYTLADLVNKKIKNLIVSDAR